jgi:Matrixin
MGYPTGSRPRVLINWDSFVEQGIEPTWQWPFVDCVINAYTRWMNVAGVDVRPQFFGFTTKSRADPGELVIIMEPWHGGGASRLASLLGPSNQHYLAFHRRSGQNGTVWNFVPWNAMPGEFDMQGILLHELGHAFGLDHSTSPRETMYGGYYWHTGRYGPWKGDVAALKALVPERRSNRVRQLRSTDGARTWTDAPNELTSHSHWHTRTNQSPGVATVRASGLYNVGWSHPNQIPTWLRNDGQKTLTRNWVYYGGERSVHGPAYASDDCGRLLWAWVSDDDSAALRVVRSFNGGVSWYELSRPPIYGSGGTPGLAWTTVNGVPTWVLVWSQFDRSDQVNTGFVRASISQNNGATWSAPVFLDTTLKALSGVSIAADRYNNLVVGLALANHVGVNGLNHLVTMRCMVSDGKLVRTQTMLPAETTRIQPCLAYDPVHRQFVMAWRGQNFATTLATMVLQNGAKDWTGKVDLLGVPSHVAPAAAASEEYHESVLWYAHE